MKVYQLNIVTIDVYIYIYIPQKMYQIVFVLLQMTLAERNEGGEGGREIRREKM